VGWLGLGPRLVGRIGSGVQVSASFQIFVLRMLLFTQWGLPPGGFYLGVISGEMSPGGYFLESKSDVKIRMCLVFFRSDFVAH